MLTANLESPLPPSLPAGSATALYVSGTAWVDGAPARGIELLVDGVPARLDAVAMPRFDMPVRRSGFWGVVAVRAGEAGSEVVLSVQAPGDGAVELGRIPVLASRSPGPLGSDPALIAICLATYEPDPQLLARQVASLRAQSHTRWICVISDDSSSPHRFEAIEALVGGDPRFRVSRTRGRIGFYRNFERALTLAPAEAALVALCDQDDVWHPEKLATLRAAIGGAALVYSDARVVGTDGALRGETMWRERRNNWTDLASLLIANTITGSAALMRRDVVQRALPFPDAPGLEFHDHWLALVALACGEIAFVDRPLYDYVQHATALLGGVSARRRARWLPRPRMGRAAYFLGYAPGRVRAAALLARCGDRLTAAKRRGLERFLRADRSLLWFAWLLLRGLRRRETLGSERELAPGIVWLALAEALARLPRWPGRWLLDTRFPEEDEFEQRRLRRWRESL